MAGNAGDRNTLSAGQLFVQCMDGIRRVVRIRGGKDEDLLGIVLSVDHPRELLLEK